MVNFVFAPNFLDAYTRISVNPWTLFSRFSLAGTTMDNTPNERELLRSSYGSFTPFKIFVSSEMRSGKLSAFRRAAAQAVASTRLAKPWWWEGNSVAGPYSSESECIGNAKTSDGLILILGETITKIVEAEYDAAREERVATFLFLQNGVDRDSTAREFITRTRGDGNVTQYFDGEEDLHEKICNALFTYLIRSTRENVLNRFHGSARYAGSELHSHTSENWALVAEEQLSFAFGSPVGPASPTDESRYSIDNLLSEVRVDFERLIEVGYTRGAIDLSLRAIEVIGSSGHHLGVMSLSRMLRDSVLISAFSDSDRAWLLNAEGLSLSFLGKHEEAISRFQMMEHIGRSSGDLSVTSTALQNIATQLQLTENYEAARATIRLAITEKKTIGDYHGIAQLAVNAASLAEQEGNSEEAYRLLSDTNEILTHLNDTHLLSTYYGNLGRLFAKDGDLQAAEQYFRKALASARKSGDLQATVNGYQSLGTVNLEQSKPQKAIRWYRQGMRLAESIRSLEQLELLNIGMAHAFHLKGQENLACAHLQSAAELSSQLGHRLRWAENVANLGATFVNSGNTDDAISQLNLALEAFQTLGDIDWQIRVRRNLAAAYQNKGDSGSAVLQIDEMIRLFPIDSHTERVAAQVMAGDVLTRSNETRLGHSRYQIALIDSHTNLGANRAAEIALGAAHNMEAQNCHREAMVLFTEGITISATVTGMTQYALYEGRAFSCLALGDRARAEDDLAHCIRLAESQGWMDLYIRSLCNRSEILRQLNQLVPALELAQTALQTARAFGDSELLRASLGATGLALGNLDKLDEAKQALGEMLSLAQQHRDFSDEAIASGGLALIASQLGDLERSLKLHRRAVMIERREKDTHHLCEDLAGIVGLKSEKGDHRGLNSILQELVNAAQEANRYEFLASVLSNAARNFYTRNIAQTAAELYGLAVISDLFTLNDDGSNGRMPGTIDLIRFVSGLSMEEGQVMLEKVLVAVSETEGVTSKMVEILKEAIFSGLETWTVLSSGHSVPMASGRNEAE